MLAIWATKIVMVAEHIGPNDPLLTQSDRSHLKNTLTPPPGWHVYLGSYNGALFRELSICQSVGELRVPAIDGGVPTPHNLEVTSLGIGEAVFLVVNSSWSELWPRYGPVLGSQGAGMVQIWPTFYRTDSVAPLDHSR
jgi:hypothetical protein